MNVRSITRALAVSGMVSTLLTGCFLNDSDSGSSDSGETVNSTPDFGPNVTVFDPETPLEEINSTLRRLSAEPEFSENRHAVFFMPGTYGSAEGEDDPSTATDIVNSEVGYYTAVYGLGRSPEDVHINGALHVEPRQLNPDGNPQDDTLDSDSLITFWRSLTNLTINPIQRPVGEDAQRTYPEGIAPPHTLRWNVSQAAPLRRVNILGDLDLTGRYGSYAFGSFIANSNIDGAVISGDGTVERAQAHWYTRNSWMESWDGRAISYVFSGVEGAPVTDFGQDGITSISTTPVSREAPFLFVDEQNDYYVFAPNAKTHSTGTDWSTAASDGKQIPIDQFYIATPEDNAANINEQLSGGKHLIVTPGVYDLEASIEIDRAGTVVLGLGLPSLVPMEGTAAIEVGDVDGVILSGVMVDAGPVESDVLIQVGEPGSFAGNPQDPTTLNDVFVRIGGPLLGKAVTSLEINSNNVILDHGWLWRGDHGTGTGWGNNTADHALVVNGDDVTVLGLWAEHYQKNQVIWNGERGRTIFYQSEMPYFPPSQDSWMNGSKEGYASYVVSDQVSEHEASGVAIYTLFILGDIHASSAVEAPETQGVSFESIASAVIAGGGGIRHIINDYGPSADAATPNSAIHAMSAVVRLEQFPPPTQQ